MSKKQFSRFFQGVFSETNLELKLKEIQDGESSSDYSAGAVNTRILNNKKVSKDYSIDYVNELLALQKKIRRKLKKIRGQTSAQHGAKSWWSGNNDYGSNDAASDNDKKPVGNTGSDYDNYDNAQPDAPLNDSKKPVGNTGSDYDNYDNAQPDAPLNDSKKPVGNTGSDYDNYDNEQPDAPLNDSKKPVDEIGSDYDEDYEKPDAVSIDDKKLPGNDGSDYETPDEAKDEYEQPDAASNNNKKTVHEIGSDYDEDYGQPDAAFNDSKKTIKKNGSDYETDGGNYSDTSGSIVDGNEKKTNLSKDYISELSTLKEKLKLKYPIVKKFENRYNTKELPITSSKNQTIKKQQKSNNIKIKKLNQKHMKTFNKSLTARRQSQGKSNKKTKRF